MNNQVQNKVSHFLQTKSWTWSERYAAYPRSPLVYAVAACKIVNPLIYWTGIWTPNQLAWRTES